MRIICEKQYQMIPKQLLRKCQYHEFLDPNTRQLSYARPLQSSMLYPRFHIYVERSAQGFIINLHLDQKKPSYQGTSAHAGEYDGEVVEAEAARITHILNQYLFVS